jgi:hypothetical protein
MDEAADEIVRLEGVVLGLIAERDEARQEAEELRKETCDHGGAFGQFERESK